MSRRRAQQQRTKEEDREESSVFLALARRGASRGADSIEGVRTELLSPQLKSLHDNMFSLLTTDPLLSGDSLPARQLAGRAVS